MISIIFNKPDSISKIYLLFILFYLIHNFILSNNVYKRFSLYKKYNNSIKNSIVWKKKKIIFDFLNKLYGSFINKCYLFVIL